MTHSAWILGLPHPYDQIQAPYRLESYINIAVAGALIATLALVTRAGPRVRRWSLLMVPLLLFIMVQARGQVLEPSQANMMGPQWRTAAPYLTNDARLGMADYVNAEVAEYQPNRQFPVLLFSPKQAEQENRATGTVDAQPGDYVASNLKVSNPLIKVKGAEIVARDQAGNAFLEISAGNTPGAARVEVTPANPAPVVLGRIVSLLGLLGLATVGLVLFLRRR
jgi:hypothetical protein